MWKQTYPCFFSGNLERRKTAAKAKRNISKRENCMTFYKEHYVLAQVKCYYLYIYMLLRRLYRYYFLILCFAANRAIYVIVELIVGKINELVFL